MTRTVRSALLIVLIILLCACTNGTKYSDQNESQIPQLTKEYLLEHTDLTEKDLENVDLQDFIKDQGITPESLDKVDLIELLRRYKEKQDVHVTPSPNQKNEKKETGPVTKDYLLEHSSITEEDLIDVDAEDFIALFELTPELLEQYDAADFLSIYKRNKALPETYDYTYIREKAHGKITEEDFDKIRVMTWEHHENMFNTRMVIDIHKGVVYYGDGMFLDDINDEDKVADWSEEDYLLLRNTLLDSGITKWDNEYIGTDEGTTGLFAWEITFEMEDGHCVDYKGRGVLDSGTPDSMFLLLEALKDHFVH